MNKPMIEQNERRDADRHTSMIRDILDPDDFAGRPYEGGLNQAGHAGARVMLDLLEKLGIDFDSSDKGQSLRLHSRIRPHAKPQSLCSAVTDARLWCIVWAIGFWHCLRSWERYHGDL